ncbi:MAG: hypothetical protein ACT4PL_01190 [Phycisphaerales bacterium]
MPSPSSIADLRERIRGIESSRAHHAAPTLPRAPTSPADHPWPVTALPFGAIHEWFASDRAPPIGLLLHAAAALLLNAPPHTAHVVFIGRPVWPSIFALRAHRLTAAAMFIDPPPDDDRLYAIDLALRSPAVRIVIADGAGLDLAATRRLQLAARPAPHGSLALLARPARERVTLSAATTRWAVEPAPSTHPRPGWRVRLLRMKGNVAAGPMEALVLAPPEDP